MGWGVSYGLQPREPKHNHCGLCGSRLDHEEDDNYCESCSEPLCEGCAFECLDCGETACRNDIVEFGLENDENEFRAEYRCRSCAGKGIEPSAAWERFHRVAPNSVRHDPVKEAA